MMRLPPFTYLAPRTVADAARALAEHGAEAMLVADPSGVCDLLQRGNLLEEQPGKLGGDLGD